MVQTGTCPGQPVITEGPDLVDMSGVPVSEYSTTGTTDATTYEWQVLPSTAGIIAGTDLKALLVWNKSNLTQAQINVRGINQYGYGPWSEDKITMLYTTVRLPDYENNATEIYPNPCDGRFRIKTSKVVTKIEVMDKLGKTHLTTLAGSKNDEFSYINLPNGIYFVRIYIQPADVITRKLIITR